MGEMANPTPADRAASRNLAREIVQAVIDDEGIECPCELVVKTSSPAFYLQPQVDPIIAQLAQEIVLLADQLDFIAHSAFTGTQSAFDRDPDLRLGILRGIYDCAREGTLPEWWENFKKEREHG